MAQSCYRMQAELAELQSQGNGDGPRYERAYREQASVLERTERRARDAGCFGGFFFGARPQRACNTLVPKLRDMQTNLWRLDRLRRQRGGDNQGRIRTLQFMIAARGCDPYDGGLQADDGWPGGQQYSSGTYRTLCVRTCDGYYFPISFSTTREHLPQDERACQAMCPGTESKLFFHDNPGGAPENMTALDGQAYSSLPTAFKYRTALAESCSCRPAGGYATLTAANPTGAVEEVTAPLPRPRPAPGEDPETLANRLGGLDAAAEQPAATAAISSAEGRQVRVVGPAYWDTNPQDELIITPVPN